MQKQLEEKNIKMKSVLKLVSFCLLVVFMNGCAVAPTQPAIVPAIEIPEPPQHSLGIIGAVEPIYFLPMKTPFIARIDTGATNSSIDVRDIRRFERDGEKWVSFVLRNEENGETHRFEKKIERNVNIVRAGKDEKRVAVMMDVQFGNEIINTEFSLANRDKFEYQALIGRNILTGRAIVDTSVSNTLH